MHASKTILTKRTKPDGSTYAVAAGSSNLTGEIIDTAGYEWIRIITGFGTITAGAVTSTKVQQNTANSASGMADLEGSAITVADTDDNKIVITEIFRPRERYICPLILRATQNAVIDFQLVEMGGSRKLPITDDATVATVEVWQSPAEGTA